MFTPPTSVQLPQVLGSLGPRQPAPCWQVESHVAETVCVCACVWCGCGCGCVRVHARVCVCVRVCVNQL